MECSYEAKLGGFEWHTNPRAIKILKRTIETLICALYGDFNFYTLLDQSVYIKVVENQKANNFYIGGFSCSVEQFGLNCKKPQEHPYG